jgi:AcrR family transcriptional regulator
MSIRVNNVSAGNLSPNNQSPEFDIGQSPVRCSRMKAIMVGRKKTDRRPQRTKRQLSQALVDLIQEKRFDDITIQNVIDRADVGRSTFYTHFRDKEDLFQKDWERFLDGFAQHIDWDNEGSFFPVVYLFRHLKEVQPFYKSLARSRKTDSVFKTGTSYLSRKIEAALTAKLETGGKLSLTKLRSTPAPALSIPIPILANFLAIELFALLKWWLDHDMPYAPERMHEIYHELVGPSVIKALQG